MIEWMPNTIGAPIRHSNGNRERAGRRAASTVAAICSATVTVMWGRLLGDRWAAWLRMPSASMSCQMRSTAASVSASNNISTECTISRPGSGPRIGRTPPR